MFYFELLEYNGERLLMFVAPCKISDKQIKKASKKAWLKATREASGYIENLITIFAYEFNASPIELETFFDR